MDGAVITDSTFPPQCGHFFKCGPATVSIFSVFFPHFTHSYSYSGTARSSQITLNPAVYHALLLAFATAVFCLPRFPSERRPSWKSGCRFPSSFSVFSVLFSLCPLC